ncbi:MAG: methionyl-tRNA formyltransferase, partial [Mycobacteriaceae bacterium]
VLTPRSPAEPDFLRQLAAHGPDCCPVVAYGALLPAAALVVPRVGWVNLHFSLLPAWRGAAPVQAALRSGDEVTGASTFLIEVGLDTGPVFGITTEAVHPTDTAGALLERLATAGAMLLESTMDGLATDSIHAVPQSADGVSYAPKVTVEDARVPWDQSAHAVDRVIRSVTPHPGAWTTVGDLRLKVGPVAPRTMTGLKPGELQVTTDGVFLGTATTAVKLSLVQPPGKKMMAASDWARGARLEHGVRAQ